MSASKVVDAWRAWRDSSRLIGGLEVVLVDGRVQQSIAAEDLDLASATRVCECASGAVRVWVRQEQRGVPKLDGRDVSQSLLEVGDVGALAHGALLDDIQDGAADVVGIGGGGHRSLVRIGHTAAKLVVRRRRGTASALRYVGRR